MSKDWRSPPTTHGQVGVETDRKVDNLQLARKISRFGQIQCGVPSTATVDSSRLKVTLRDQAQMRKNTSGERLNFEPYTHHVQILVVIGRHM